MRKVVVATVVGTALVGVANAVELGNGFSVGGGVDVGMQTMKDSGYNPKANVGFDYKNSGEPMVRLNGYVEKSNVIAKAVLLYSKGSDTYTQTNGYVANADLKHTAIEGQIGYRFGFDKFNAIPYVGIGTEKYSYTDDKGGQFDDKATYGKIGVGLAYAINQKIGLYSDGFIGKTLHGTYSDNLGNHRDLKKNARYGIEIGMVYDINPALIGKIGVFYNHTSLDKEITGTTETYKQYGILVGLGF